MIQNLNEFPVIIDIPVSWGEMDAFGHVNNVVYFRYFESARIAYLGRVDYQKIAKELDIGIILGAVNAKFITPLFYPDQIKVGASIVDIGKDRVVMDYALYSSQQDKIAAIGSSTIVTYDYKNKCKANLPKDLVDRIKQVQGS